MKIHPWAPSCSMQTDRRTEGLTDITKLTVAFRVKKLKVITCGTDSFTEWKHSKGLQLP